MNRLVLVCAVAIEPNAMNAKAIDRTDSIFILIYWMYVG
jgi:hypothetical protein